ncbi:hypothetical protein TruAng_007217 [Truncatella angustata]|nr:hypothetical protein TruAng_007217 [Truncatella angustata]
MRRRPAPLSKLHRAVRGLSCLALGRTQPLRLAQVQRLSAVGGSPRAYATVAKAHDEDKSQPPRQIAVLGGGLTGLTAAHYLARHATNAHITLYEGDDRLGGWIDGKRVRVSGGDGEEVLMQRGARMLRSGATSNKYEDLVFYDVVANLKLQDKVLYPKGAAESRYIYYPDHLVQLPSKKLSFENIIKTIRSILTEPLWTGCFSAAARWSRHFTRNPALVEQRRKAIKDTRTVFDKDESVADFLGRVFGNKNSPPITNIVSAMLHGIYGGDVHKLSAKHTIFENFWQQDMFPLHQGLSWIARKEFFLQYDILDGPNRLAVIEMAEKARNHNLLAFSDGLVTLVEAFEADLRAMKNVTIKQNTPITALELQDNKVAVDAGPGSGKYDQVLSTLFSGDVAELAKPANSLPSLAATEAVSIMVVNLYYPNPDLLKENPGFGYLIPQSVPPEENPECALGVLFDSDIEMGKDVQGTKLTVMLGGHYWNDWSILPDKETSTAMAMAVVERHLGISPEEPVTTSAKMCRNCLPQHNVGHVDRLRRAHYELSSAFQGKLTVAGPSYTTVGAIGSMRAGYDAAMRIARGHGQPWFQRSEKGLGMWNWHFEMLERAEKELGIAVQMPLDHVGTTGLEWATENQTSQIGEMPAENLWFKEWTRENERFLDDDGNWTVDTDELFKTPGLSRGRAERLEQMRASDDEKN